MELTTPPPPLDRLRSQCDREWENLQAARRGTEERLDELGSLEDLQADNTSIVVFGSFARKELTQGSDADWSLLIDGPSDPEHYRLVHEISEVFSERGLAEPGATGTFGSMVFSHELIHYIGGVQDTNQNLTRRILLLLESLPIGDRVAHDRVVKAILERYLVYDQSVLQRSSDGSLVPRFLLNDIVRFWRTMAVDYAAKRWEQADKKWALRNAKLRMSRKLLFVSGLLLCFSWELEQPEKSEEEIPGGDGRAELLLDFFWQQSMKTPLDSVAEAYITWGTPQSARLIFDAYDEFLGILHDSASREKLGQLAFDEANESLLFQRIREISHRFQKGLDDLFFRDGKILDLIQKYGVF